MGRLYFLLFTISTALMLLLGNTSEVLSVQSPASDLFQWRNINIQGMGYVTGLIISPKSGNVYIRTDVGGTYRFDRKYNRWLPLMDMFDTSFAAGGVGVESIAVDSQKSERIYAAVNSRNFQLLSEADKNKSKNEYSGEVLVSEDWGNSWKPTGLGKKNIFVGPNKNYRFDTGERLAIDPNKPDLIYFASRQDGLWKKDGKKDWIKVGGGLPAANSLPEYQKSDGKKNQNIPGFTFTAFDKRSGKINQPSQILYAGVHGSGVWQSNDAGKSWKNISQEKNSEGKDPLEGIVASDGTLYVSFGTKGGNGKKASGGVRKYENSKWTDITPDGKNKVYSGISVQINKPNVLMTISGDRTYRSRDSGITWSKQKMEMGVANNPSAPPYYDDDANGGAAAIVIDPQNPKQVWWTNGWGVARTDNVNVSRPCYKWLMRNLEELDANMVRVPPLPKVNGGADLWSAVHDKIGFRHLDRDQVPKSKINPGKVPVSPSFKWVNRDWRYYPVPFPHVAGATGMDYSYQKPNYGAFVGFHQWQGNWSIHGITKDNGKTWQGFPSVPQENLWKSDKSGQERTFATAGQIAISPTNPQNMVWAPTWGTWTHYTTNGGRTWDLAYNLDHQPKPEPFDPRNNNHTHYQFLPKSWANSISPWLSAYILASDRQDPEGKTFYYFDGESFYYSKDGGATWKRGASGIFPKWIVRPGIISNPTVRGDIWMTFARNPEDIKGNKLYRSFDGGKNFQVVGSVESADFMTFGKGDSDTKPYIYIFGQIKGKSKNTMYKSENMGKTWVQISNPVTLQFPGITWLEGDMRKQDLLYVATTGRGIMFGKAKICAWRKLLAKFNFLSINPGLITSPI
ncbi:MAG: sialidase family protein [Cyanobacteria bacterium P01_A01_bin.84]